MSDKPEVGDLVWVRPKCSDLEEDWYLTEYPWDDEGLDVTPFKPTEVVQIKRLMDEMQSAVQYIRVLTSKQAQEILADSLQNIINSIKADGRVTIDREGK